MTDHGKIVYLEIPTDDVNRSAAFYRDLFGWRTRRRSDGELAFDDATGNVSGSWRTGREPQSGPGILVYVNVADIDAAVGAVVPAGGLVVQGVGGDPGELTARIRDPFGNLLGLYQEPVG